MNRPLVTFYMQAYNAEEYIEQAIESVLNQTLENIEFILLNNASTDRTGEICRAYAKKDTRIVYLENEKNTVLNPDFQGECRYPNGEYYSNIDADDYLELDYAEILYNCAKLNDADIVICGTEMFSDKKNSLPKSKIPPSINSKDLTSMSSNFMELYGLIRQMWAKIYRTEFYFDSSNINYAWDRPECVKSASDTYAVLRYMGRCKSFVTVPKVLHHYRLHENSYYQTEISVNRVFESKYIYAEGIRLLDEWSINTPELKTFIQDVHLASMIDNIQNALRNKTASINDRLTMLQEVVKDDLFCEYGTTEKSKDITFEALRSVMNEVMIGKNQIFISQVGDYFIARMYKALESQEDISEFDLASVLLSSICDDENKHLWGLDLISKVKKFLPSAFVEIIEKYPDVLKIILRDRLLVRSLINEEYEITKIYLNKYSNIEEINNVLDIVNLHNKNVNDEKKKRSRELKANLLDFINSEDIENAIPLLLELLSNKMLDREGLYFKILISWNIGETELALITAEVARVFWSEDGEMLALCADVFAAINSENRAKALYESAIKLSDDIDFTNQVRDKIKELNIDGGV